MQQRTMGEMVRDQRPLAMSPETTIQEACTAMRQRRVGAVLVVDDQGHLAGIFTGRDALSCLAQNRQASSTTLADVMTRNPVCLAPVQHAHDALQVMHDMGVRHVPVTEAGRVVGIISRYDFRAREHARHDEETGFFEMLR